jgi:hypothetical protein
MKLYISTLLIGLGSLTPAHATTGEARASDILSLAIPAVGLAMTYQHDDRDGFEMLSKTMLTNLGATLALKYSLNDTKLGKRPNGDDYSFPSGHTSNACAGATFIGQRYGWHYGSAAMIPAAYVGWARVDQRLHHVRDVVAGCAIGVAAGLWLTQPLADSTIVPFLDQKVFGIEIKSTW